MITLRQSVLWRWDILRRKGLRFAHVVGNPFANRLPKKRVGAVLCGRNDNYTPDFTERVETCLDWAFANGLSEAIWVEWNPPPENPFLACRLAERFPKLKAYVVAAHVHTEISENRAFNLLEYHAKNVGIRRATAEWVCGTNADIIWGADVFPWFSCLRPGVVYQTRRVDFRWTGETVTLPLLRDCSRYLRFFRDDYVPLDGAGDFTLAERTFWFRTRGYDEGMRKQKRHCDSRGIYQFLAHGGRVVRIGTTYHMDHPNSAGYGSFAKDGVELERQAGIPYENPDNWGLADATERQIGERIWMLE